MTPLLLWRSLQLAAGALRADKLRSLLTLAAVGLAVTALTIIVATMEGAARKAAEMAVKFGPTAVNVMGGDVTGQSLGRSSLTLTWKDVRALEAHLPGVERVSPYLYRVGVTVQGNGRTHVAGALGGSGADHGLHWSWPLAEGREFSPDDVARARRVCFLGTSTARKLFGEASALGETVRLDGIPFTVIGIHSPLGLVTGGVDMDDRATVPITTMAGRFNISREHLIQIRVTFPLYTPEEAMPAKVEAVRAVLRSAHGFGPDQADDFILFTAGDVLDFISTVKGGVALFLGVTAVAAVVVSGFILANLFHLSVSERQEEIGLKKALGANRAAIVSQFLLEAFLLCLGGAAAGLGAGLAASFFMERTGLLTVALSGFLFFSAFAGACGIGFFFALRPARRAAAMPPVAALRGGA